MSQNLRPLQKLPKAMGKVADVVNTIIDHIKNGSGGGGGVDFTPQAPLQLTEDNKLKINSSNIKKPLELTQDGNVVVDSNSIKKPLEVTQNGDIQISSSSIKKPFTITNDGDIKFDNDYVLEPLKVDADGHLMIDKSKMKTINYTSIFGEGNIKVGAGQSDYIAPTGVGTTVRLNQNLNISDPSEDETQGFVTIETKLDSETIDNTKPGYKCTPLENAITWIRANSHVYVGKLTTDSVSGKDEMQLLQLNDEDYSKFADGTDASVYINDSLGEGWDVFMKLPKFWYKIGVDDNGMFMTFIETEATGYTAWDDRQLIGVYEAFIDSNNHVRSLSLKTSTGNVNHTNFKSYSRARNTNKNLNAGEGYRLITKELSDIMAWLFYGYYGTTNCQAVCGFGTNDYSKTTGTKDSIGMTDTDSTTGNQGSIKFWGLENWWGNKSEWLDNIKTTDGSGAISVMNFDETDKYSLISHNTGGGNCIVKFNENDFVASDGLLIPEVVTTNNNYDTHYCDGFWLGGSSVGYRSGSSANPVSGVGYLGLNNAPSHVDAYRGSRLAYCGNYYID